MKKKTFPVLLCLAGILINYCFSQLAVRSGLPLYLDTIGTIAVTLTAGLGWGILTGALFNIISHSLIFWGWGGYFFALCNIATAVLTYIFIRLFPEALNLRAKKSIGKTGGMVTNKAVEDISIAPLKCLRLSRIVNLSIVLLLLSFALCLLMSVMGGVIATVIRLVGRGNTKGFASSSLTLTLFPINFPALLAEILSRTPVNLIDRPISVFTGYALAAVWLYPPFRKRESA